jgi:hypothetical protein
MHLNIATVLLVVLGAVLIVFRKPICRISNYERREIKLLHGIEYSGKDAQITASSIGVGLILLGLAGMFGLI